MEVMVRDYDGPGGGVSYLSWARFEGDPSDEAAWAVRGGDLLFADAGGLTYELAVINDEHLARDVPEPGLPASLIVLFAVAGSAGLLLVIATSLVKALSSSPRPTDFRGIAEYGLAVSALALCLYFFHERADLFMAPAMIGFSLLHVFTLLPKVRPETGWLSQVCQAPQWLTKPNRGYSRERIARVRIGRLENWPGVIWAAAFLISVLACVQNLVELKKVAGIGAYLIAMIGLCLLL